MNIYIQLGWAGCHIQLEIKRPATGTFIHTNAFLNNKRDRPEIIVSRASEKEPQRGKNNIVILTLTKNNKHNNNNVRQEFHKFCLTISGALSFFKTNSFIIKINVSGMN